MASRTGRREFSFIRDDVLYRVAVFSNPHQGVTYVMRQKKRWERTLAESGLSSATQEALLHPDLKGAVLVLGEMSSGKTSTISTAIEARLIKHGGLALVLEDPIETRLSGTIGKGLSLQLEVETYADELVRGMRSNADLFMIGEIRDGVTAAEFLQAGSNGHLLLASAHAQSIAHGLIRIRSLIGGPAADVNAIMSQSLALVIYQSLRRTPKSNGEGVNCRLTSETLLISGAPNEAAIREKINQGNFRALADEITAQKNAVRWSGTA
ncbi:ATPase, T2SS/T4P/T4SS family [Bordetella flabilis]